MDITICDARSAHLPQLEALECACFSTPWTRAQLASQLPDDRHVFHIAAAGETVLGYANFLHVLDEGDIGNVAVAPEYRRQGVASALTSRLALEILAREKAPFYCCAWSNIRSARNAVRSGFRPAWAQLTVKPEAEIARLNGAD